MGTASDEFVARIGVVTTSYPRESGDPAGQFVAGCAQWLAEQGHAVEVVAAGPGAERVDGLPVRRIDGGQLFYRGGAPDALAGSRYAWAEAARFQLALCREICSLGWDGVVSHWLVPSGLAAAALRCPHVAIAHSSDIALLRRSRLGRAYVRWLSRRADLVYSARHLVLPRAPGRVVPMGISPVPGDRNRGRAQFRLERTTVLFLGRLVPVKALDLLIEALPPALDLVVAGAGPLAASWRRAAAGSRVRFLGEVRGQEKWDLLAAADLFCLPSRRLPDGRSEGMPTVLFEAMAAGLPIVATDASGAAEVLSHGRSALIVPSTVLALRQALSRLAFDPRLAERLAQAARAASGDHAWPSVGPRLLPRWSTDSGKSRLHDRRQKYRTALFPRSH